MLMVIMAMARREKEGKKGKEVRGSDILVESVVVLETSRLTSDTLKIR